MSYNPYDPYNSAVGSVYENMEQIRRLTETVPDAVRQIQQEWEARQELLRQFEERGDIQRLTGTLNDVARQVQQEWETRQEIVRQLEERGDVRRMIEQRQELLRQLEDRNSVLQVAAQGQELLRQIERIGDMAALRDVLYQNRGVINSYVLDTFSEPGAVSFGLISGFGRFTRANTKLVKSYQQVVESEEKGEPVPQEFRGLPTTEAFTSAEVVAELTVDSEIEATETDDDEASLRRERRKIRVELRTEAHQQLKPALETLDPRLVSMWEGGLLAISGTNPDKVRHFTVSLRELIREVLHRLAPDEEVRKWNSDPKLYHNNQPTRRARMQYICRSIDQPTFEGFIQIDYSVLLETIDLFHKGTHVATAGFTPEQLDAMETKVARTLLFLLQLGRVR